MHQLISFFKSFLHGIYALQYLFVLMLSYQNQNHSNQAHSTSANSYFFGFIYYWAHVLRIILFDIRWMFCFFYMPSFRLWSESLRLLFSNFYFIFNKNNISFMVPFPKLRDSYFICCSFLFMFSMFIEIVIAEDWGCSTSTHEMIEFMFVPWHFHLSAKLLRMISDFNAIIGS